MAKAVGRASPVGYHQVQRIDVTTLAGLASRLERLGKAQGVARDTADGEDPNYGAAFDQLFAAVALLNPMNAAAEIQKLVR
jgi:hypothetical protein